LFRTIKLNVHFHGSAWQNFHEDPNNICVTQWDFCI